MSARRLLLAAAIGLGVCGGAQADEYRAGVTVRDGVIQSLVEATTLRTQPTQPAQENEEVVTCVDTSL